MNAGFVVVLAILVFVVITVWKGVRIVPQGEEWIVERLGKYHGTLSPGLNIIIPYLDDIAYKLVTKDIILDVQEQEVITKDNAVILTNAIAFIKVTDPVKAVYGVTDFSEAIRNMIMTTLRSIVGEMDLERGAVLARQDQAAAARKHRRRGHRLGPDRQIGRDPGHQAVRIDAAGDGNAGQRRSRTQRRGDARGGPEAGDDPRGRSAPRVGQARRDRAGDAGRSVGRIDPARYRIARQRAGADDVSARREVHRRDAQRLANRPNAKVVVLPADLQDALKGLFAKSRG